jgi:hypothetical protein
MSRSTRNSQRAVVGDDDEGRALFARALEHQVEHPVRRLAVQVAGGLVGQHAGRLGDQRTRDGHALAFAARQLRRRVAHARGQAHARQHGLCRGPRASAGGWRRMRSGIATLSSALNSGSRWWNW